MTHPLNSLPTPRLLPTSPLSGSSSLTFLCLAPSSPASAVGSHGGLSCVLTGGIQHSPDGQNLKVLVAVHRHSSSVQIRLVLVARSGGHGGWAISLSAGETELSTEYSFFAVTIDLTDSGHEHVQAVLGLLFKYIQLLQKSGVCEWMFKELAAISEIAFHYQDKIPPIDYVVDISSNMHNFRALTHQGND